jgi:hypothetical protein
VGSLVWRRLDDGALVLAEAPTHLELSLAELCGANNDTIHAEGRHIVVDNSVWYLPTGYDTTAGRMHLVKDRDDRSIGGRSHG